MITVVEVDFSESKDPKLSQLGCRIPQFFNKDFESIVEVNRYLRFISRRLRYKSIKTFGEHIKEFMIWADFSCLDLEDMTDDLFDCYVDALCHYRKASGEPLSWNTVNARAAGAYRYLVWCYEQGYCQGLNPAEISNSYRSARIKYKIKGHPSKQLREATKFLLLDDAVRFIDALSDVSLNRELRRRNKLIGSLMLQSGLRISEITGFPLRDLPEVPSNGHSTPARVVGKGGVARVILIPNKLVLKLWEYVDFDRERICDHMKAQVHNWHVPDELFITESGGAIKNNWIEKLFAKVSAALGVKTVPHTLRHTYATYHYLLNRDLPGLAKLLGHASEITTRNCYVHTATLVSYVGSYSKLQDEIDRLIEV